MSTAVFTLTPIESRRLLGKAVAKMSVVQHAFRSGRLIVALGTTNAYVLEELTGEKVDKGTYTAGLITSRVACLTDAATRQAPAVFVGGKRTSRPWQEVLSEFTSEDVFIKGANAIDLRGNAGILLGDKQGGTIGQAIGALSAFGAHLIIPVGMEKLVPDVRSAAMVMGRSRTRWCWGMPCGLFVVSTGKIVTEIEALDSLFGVTATVVAAGGVAGSEGAITIALQGTEDSLLSAMDVLGELKKELRFTVTKRRCSQCLEPCARTDNE